MFRTAMTIKEMNAEIRETFNLKPKPSANYFNKEEITHVLESLGYSPSRLPKWWTKTKAGVTHPGRENHLWIMSQIRIFGLKSKKKQVPTQQQPMPKSCKNHKDVEKWVHNVIKHDCPRNMAGMLIEESQDKWSVTFTISKNERS